MKYEAIVNFIQSQPVYDEFVNRKSIPATDTQLEKLVKNGILEAKNFSIWHCGDKHEHIETQYRKI